LIYFSDFCFDSFGDFSFLRFLFQELLVNDMAVADAPLTEYSEYHRSSDAVGFDVDRCFSCFPLNDAMFLKVLTFLLLFFFFLLLPPLLLPLPPPPHHRALHPSLPPPVLSYRDYTTSNSPAGAAKPRAGVPSS